MVEKRPRPWAVYRLLNPKDSVGVFGVLDRQKFKGELYVVTKVKKTGLQWVDLRSCATGKEVIGQYTCVDFFEQFVEVT